MALVPLNLFVTHDGKSKRQHVTCVYKCGDACSKPVPNTSDNEYFGDIVKACRAARCCRPAASPSSPSEPARHWRPAEFRATRRHLDLVDRAAEPPPGMNFASVAPNSEDAVVVADGYEQGVVISWGDPVLPDAPKFDVNKQTGAAQRGQFGFNNDFAGLLPIHGSAEPLPARHQLRVRHTAVHVPRLQRRRPHPRQFEVEIAAIGMGVVEVERTPEGLQAGDGHLQPAGHRRHPHDTDRPRAGTDFVKTAADPEGRTVAGTFANCAGGVTPWGTVLSGEENFHDYFGAAEGSPAPGPVDADRIDRYGVSLEPSALSGRHSTRGSTSPSAQRANRFGYVVELNPWDPKSTPIKHSAMGRLKHEGANIYVTDDGAVVAYTGDDQRFDYMYKFVSAKKMQPGNDPASMAHNLTLLDEGTLYVAKLSSDIPPERDRRLRKAPREGFVRRQRHLDSVAAQRSWRPGRVAGRRVTAQEAAVFTRMAADKAGATKMDRPEDFEANPKTGKVYVALTNNDERGAPGEAPPDAANPRNDNKSGQILEITDNHTGTDFTWELLLVCGDPAAADTYYGGFDKTKVSPISCPDNLAFDSHGNLWISTDGNALDSNDGLFAVALEARTAARSSSSSPCRSVRRPAVRSSPTIWSPCACSIRVRTTTTASTTRSRGGPRAATARRGPRWSRCGSRAARSASERAEYGGS